VSVCVFVSLCVHALKEKQLELSTPKLVVIWCIAVNAEFKRSKVRLCVYAWVYMSVRLRRVVLVMTCMVCLYTQGSMDVVALLLVIFNKDFSRFIPAAAVSSTASHRLVFAFPPKTSAYRALFATVSSSGVC